MVPERPFGKSDKLADVCYDIRGPVLKEAQRLEDEGFKVMTRRTNSFTT